eukprot:COSAG01_NODE_2898_length_6893_cov_45.927878_7_plen_87_part_00
MPSLAVPRSSACAKRFHPLLSTLTEIYLCNTCSCHEILRVETPGQGDTAQPVVDGARRQKVWAPSGRTGCGPGCRETTGLLTAGLA